MFMMMMMMMIQLYIIYIIFFFSRPKILALIVVEHKVRWNTIIKTSLLKLVKYFNKYIDLHFQKNGK